MRRTEQRAMRATRIVPLTRLAAGGMAEIWLARELGAAGLERFVVLKRLLPHLAREQHIVDMFVSEARFVARLSHPNVVQIHELAEDDDGYFLVMEYVAGCTVRELMHAARHAEAKLPPDVAVCIIEQACRGAHAAHELADSSGRPLGLVHRDISPHNLMIRPEGDVKLLDFGVAKATEAAEATHTGSLTGKCGYMSPEQCLGKPLDRRSDVFAMGIVLWELLAGERLFERESEYASMQAIVSGDVRPPSAAREDLPAAFDAVLAKALATDMAERFQSADELRRALLEAAETSGVRPSRDALGATLSELLGDRLAQRQGALRDAADATSDADHTALREVLVHKPDETRSDDIATVVQRRSPREPETAPRDTIVDRSPPEPDAPARRRVLWPALTFATLAAAAIAGYTLTREQPLTATTAPPPPAETASVPAGPGMRLVIAPTVKPEVIRQELAPFARWLGGKMDRPIEVVIAESYEQSGELVAESRAELGLLPPLLFLQTLEKEPRLQPVALRLYDGARASDGYLLAREDSKLTGAADLRGQRVCFVDRESTTGYLLPRIWMRDAGLDPDKDVVTIVSGDHLAALRDLAARRCEAAAVYSGAYLSANQQGIRVGSMRVLAVTGRVPQDVLAAAPDLPEADVSRLRRLLLDFEPQRDIQAPRIGAVLGISGFGRYQAHEFDRIREAAKREGILGVDAGP